MSLTTPSTKEKIIEESINLFASKGYHAVSIREIARSVGIKESSIYNHFKSKESILDQIFDLFQAEMAASVPSIDYLERAIEKNSFKEFWEIGLSSFLERTQTTRMEDITKIITYEMYRNERARELAFQEYFSRQQSSVRTIMGLMKEKGKILDIDLDALAMSYSYTMLALQLEWTLTRNWGLDDSIVKEKMIHHIEFISSIVSKESV